MREKKLIKKKVFASILILSIALVASYFLYNQIYSSHLKIEEVTAGGLNPAEASSPYNFFERNDEIPIKITLKNNDPKNINAKIEIKIGNTGQKRGVYSESYCFKESKCIEVKGKSENSVVFTFIPGVPGYWNLHIKIYEEKDGNYRISDQKDYAPIFDVTRLTMEEAVFGLLTLPFPIPLVDNPDKVEVTANEYGSKGIKFCEEGNYEEALKCFEVVTRIKPDWWEGHWCLGEVYSELGEMEKAVEEYKKAILINPDLPHYVFKESKYNDMLQAQLHKEEMLRKFREYNR